MNNKLRIAMIGCGQIMPSTAEGILKSDKCQMQYLYDIDSKFSNAKSEEFNVPVATDFWELIKKDDVDIVYLAVPHGQHVPLAVEAMRNGKHVMIEKPMATDISDALFLVEETKKNNVKCSIAMSVRYGSFTLAKNLIKAGLIGNITNTRIQSIGCKDKNYFTNGVGASANYSAWRAYNSLSGGGILIMNAVHNIDAMIYATGLRPKTVTAIGGNYTAKTAAVEDAIALVMNYENSNAYGVCEAMSSAFGADHSDNYNYVYGTKGTLKIGMGNGLQLYTTVENDEYAINEWINIDSDKNAPSSRTLLMDDFVDSILNDTTPFISVEDGLTVVDTITTAYKSMISGKTETLLTSK